MEVIVSRRKLWKVLRELGVEPWWRHPFRQKQYVKVTPQKVEALVEQKILRERGIHQFKGFKNGFCLLGVIAIARLTGVSPSWFRAQPDFPRRSFLTLSEWLKILPPILERHKKGFNAVIELEKLKAEVILRANEIFETLVNNAGDGSDTEGDASGWEGVSDGGADVQVR